ncbi:MAG: sugar transferase [Chitinophagaceae bacterium]
MKSKRLFDVVISFFALIVLLPFLMIIAVCIKLTSKGPVIFSQKRVGKNNKDFILYKFRTMHVNAQQQSSLTIGTKDKRITKIGFFLRKYKLDELPQFWNVLKGNMSIVGPRPELRKYVELYTEEQKKILFVKPGITDYASIEFKNESEFLARADDPEIYYITKILPLKIKLNNRYISNNTISEYFFIIFKTLFPY